MSDYEESKDMKRHGADCGQTAEEIAAEPASPTPRRRKVSRSEFSDAFVTELHADFVKHGASAIRKARRTSALQYLRICAAVLPKDVTFKQESEFEDMTDEEIEQRIAHILRNLRQLGYRNPYTDIYEGLEPPNGMPALPKPKENA
jgi:hypothetical protein